MPKKPKNSGPFLRGARGVYYCWIEGRLRSLGTKKPKIAEAKYREMLTDWNRQKAEERDSSAPRPLTVRQCFDYYLARAEGFEPNTLRNRKQTLANFCEEAKVGPLPHDRLTIDHLEDWAGKNPEWSSSTRRSYFNWIMAALNWCVRRKKIPANPIHGLEKPRWERRKRIITAEDLAKVEQFAKGEFRAIVRGLRLTGARPSELCRATVERYREGRIVLEEHKEDESGEDRIIHLPPDYRAEVEALIGSRTEGSIWRNSRGRAWTPDTIYCRFKRLPASLGLGDGVFPYSTRSRFITRGIEKGVDLVTLSDLVGHKGVDMMKKYYARLSAEHYDQSLRRISEPEIAGPDGDDEAES